MSRSVSLSARAAIRKLAGALARPLAGLVILSGCAYEVVTGSAMGTTYAITANCPDRIPNAAVAALLARIDTRMSTYDEASELMRFNRGPVGEWVPVSRELVEVVAAAKTVAEETGGALDPTVAPLVALWGFGASASQDKPDDTAIRTALLSVGHHHLRYRLAPPALAKDRALSIDLSAIAKGHAVDRLADVLRAAGCRAFLVEFGGEIRAAGPAPSGGPWRVGIDSPSGRGQLEGPIRLRDAGLATSGDYRQYTERDGRRDAHIIDPRSGRPVRHRLASVTVVAESARSADAYATALMVLGERDGRRFADDAGLAALFIVRTDEGFETLRSEAMADL
ncbi:MAG: FAD:protein FMN transferase [Gammaproteobacteria bacterium]|nr:FAD:protein FMN transferase [Gammaproteobacteria bacterium]